MKKPYLDFYRAHNICPVDQDISDLQKHFGRRDALLRQLGIPGPLLRDKTILELGPGSGYNSIHLARYRPSRYVLVDGHSESIKKARKLFDNYRLADPSIEFVESEIELFNAEPAFDLVWCEGLSAFREDPKSFAKLVGSFTGPSGILVITTVDAVSFFSEQARRIFTTLLTTPAQSFEEQITVLLPYFDSHAKTLRGMSRSPRDWIIDNLMHTYSGHLFSILDLLAAVGNDFDFYQASPQFQTDWRWYKDIYPPNERYNENASASFLRNVHNFIDYRIVVPERSAEKNLVLLALCQRFVEKGLAFDSTRSLDMLPDLIEIVSLIEREVHSFSTSTSVAIEEYLEALEEYRRTGTLRPVNMFAGLFGRGQQVSSLMRRSH